MLGDGEIREAVKNPVPASKSVNRIAEDIPLSPLSRAGAHQVKTIGGRRWLRRGPPAAPRWTGALGRARSGAGQARAGLGGGIGCRWRVPSPYLSKFLTGARATPVDRQGGWVCAGVPPLVAVFPCRDVPGKTIDGWLAGSTSARPGNVRPAIDGRFSASLVTPALP